MWDISIYAKYAETLSSLSSWIIFEIQLSQVLIHVSDINDGLVNVCTLRFEFSNPALAKKNRTRELNISYLTIALC